MKKLTLILLLAAASATMAMAQCAGHDGMGPRGENRGEHMRMGGDCHQGMGQAGMGRGQWWENPAVAKDLGLSDKQAEQIDKLTLDHRKSVIKLRADLRIAELEFRDMMEGDPSEADVRKKAKAVSLMREKLSDLKVDHMLAVRKVLTPEQQKKLKDMKPAARHQGLRHHPNPPAPPSAPK